MIDRENPFKEDEVMEDVADLKIEEEESDDSDQPTQSQKHSRKPSKNLPDVIPYKNSNSYWNSNI